MPPTKVLIRSNEELPKNKTVYYSETHFSPLGKTGKPTTKVISPVDNTGHRARAGTELFIFTSEEECIKEWNLQVQSHCEKIDVKIKNTVNYWIEEKDILAKTLIGEHTNE